MTWKSGIELCAQYSTSRHIGLSHLQHKSGPHPKGPNGKLLCRWCGREVPPGRRKTFCSGPCTDEWLIRTASGHASHLLGKRDKGVCARCGLDTRAIEAAMHEWTQELLRVQERDGRSPYWIDSHEFKSFRHRLGLTKALWEAHHIVAVVEGGGMCGLDNYQTVCRWCHQRETRNLHGRLKQKRTGQHGLDFSEAVR